ncbi:MAG: NnrU family protein, partial [Rubrivivax sp.]|nr:NnrU family protein [Rubrivivax sp.]
VYSLLSLLGLVLIVWGYGLARQQPVLLWVPPVWTRHLAALLTLPAFVMLAASQLPANSIKAKLRHPMVLGVKIWALAHLISNGMLADVVLFGSFLVWAVLSFRAARGRDRVSGALPAPGRLGPTLVAVVVGVVAWVVFALWAHAVLIGVRPFG